MEPVIAEAPPSLLTRIGQSWRDAARDVTLIVVSITIAFALDAWWGGLQQSSRVDGHIAALRYEFTALLAELDSAHGEVVDATAATRAVLDVMGTQPPSEFGDSLGRLLNRSFDVGLDAPPQGGALSAILSSGDIRLIRDDSLAYMLAEWPLLVEELKLEGSLLTASREDQLRRRLMELRVPESAIARNLGSWLSLPPTRFPLDPAVILNDVAFESMLVSRLIRLRILEDELAEDIERAELILERLRETG